MFLSYLFSSSLPSFFETVLYRLAVVYKDTSLPNFSCYWLHDYTHRLQRDVDATVARRINTIYIDLFVL